MKKSICWNFQIRCITSKSWLKRHVNDVYVKEARTQELRSRSAFKLLEIQEKHKIFRKNDVVVDLGCSPGGWCLITKKYVSKVVGVDLLPMEAIDGVEFIQGDFLDKSVQRRIIQYVRPEEHSARTAAGVGVPCINVIISDMLHNSTGIFECLCTHIYIGVNMYVMMQVF